MKTNPAALTVAGYKIVAEFGTGINTRAEENLDEKIKAEIEKEDSKS